MTEPQIVQGCRRGDREAQRALYALSADRVYRLLLRMTRNPDDALELAQDTFIRAFERIHQFDGTASVGTWVYRIAVNEALQFLRSRGRQIRLLDAARERPAPEAEDPDARMDVRDALERLPEQERLLLVLRYFEGLDYNGMAEVLERPAGTIASGLNRARRMLREELEGSAEPREETPPSRHPTG